MRAPALAILALLLAFEAVGGLVIFFARLVSGSTPGEAAHILVGAALAAIYAWYQWGHLRRVWPFRARLDYSLGLLASLSMGITMVTGLMLAAPWWTVRIADRSAAPVAYPSWVAGVHNIGSMLLLTFIAAHVAAVLLRDRRARG